MSLSVSVSTDDSCFDVPGWKDLLACDPQRHVFATPEWNRLWWEEFGAGKDLCVLIAHRDDELAAIIPLYRKVDDGKKVLRFVGGIDLTDYLGPICANEDRGEVADALVAWLRETDVEWDEFDAHNMPVPFGFAEFLVERADASGFDFVLQQEETAAVLSLPSSWEEYLSGLDSKERHELKRKQRRIGRDLPDARFRSSTAETLDKDLGLFVDMHRDAEGMKGHFMRPEIATFFERVARSFEPQGWLRLEFLEVADRPIASTFGFVLNDRYFLYNSAFEPDAKRLSPGLILVSRLVEDSIEEGLDAFDFMRGPERYKYQLGAEAVPLNNLRILAEARS